MMKIYEYVVCMQVKQVFGQNFAYNFGMTKILKVKQKQTGKQNNNNNNNKNRLTILTHDKNTKALLLFVLFIPSSVDLIFANVLFCSDR